MKIIITESQYNRILMEEEEQEILHIPSLKVFGGNWDLLQKFLELKGNPPYTISGNLDLYGLPVKSLGNLQSVGGHLDLENTPIKSLGNLTSVRRNLYLHRTPLSKKYTERSTLFVATDQIRQMVDVGGGIIL